MTTATITSATVKYAAGKPKDYGKGPRINVVATTAAGEDVKVWGNADDAALASLTKKQSVQLLFDGKGYKLVETQPSSPTPATQHTQGHGAPEDSEAVYKEALARARKRIAMAICDAKKVCEFHYGITDEAARTDLQAAAIVKETAAAILIEAGKLLG